MARPKKYIINLTEEEIKELKSTIRSKKTSKTIRSRCQIILDLDEAHGKVLTHEQLTQLFRILKKKYSYMLPIVQKMNTLKQPLNTILTGSEQQKKYLKRKIRKDFFKIKQEMELENYKIDDLRLCN